MSEIRILDDSLIDQIAAGEVVERPSSVVKELVENSVDAGASAVTIETKDGGISLIRVTDNGRGIPSSEAVSAFTRHATSKIKNFDDLTNVLTLGFRGEALSSIASVSQIEMVTKIAGEISGTRVEVHGGKFVSQQEVGAPDGTSIIMRNLFYNTPARRKFLKKPASESGYISDVVQRIALGHPEISFKYIVNNAETFHTNGNKDLKSAILSVYGKDIAKNLIAVDTEKNGFGISGFICRPQMSRGNRNYGSFFINGRYVKSDLVQSAVEEGYKTMLPVGKFPIYVLNLSINPSMVDVNVHPTKLEVRFSDEAAVFEVCYQGVLRALADAVLIHKPETEAMILNKEHQEIRNPFRENAYQLDNSQIDKPVFRYPSSFSRDTGNKTYAVDMENLAEQLIGANTYDTQNNMVCETEAPYSLNLESKPAQRNFFYNYRIIGQFFNTYWVVEQDDSVFLIDQHAAHERILYEEFLDRYKNQEINIQRLLEPLIMNFNDREIQIVKDNAGMIKGFGFELEALEENKYALIGVPFIFRGPVSSDLFTVLLDKLGNIENYIENLFDIKLHTIATISCKAAVKGNDRLSFPEAKNMIDHMLKLDNPFTCPHGRPTILELSKYDIEKMFKRIQ